jgi:8-oxo-dGTP pyrophosphatase MutT (NUDIX family)
MSDGTAPERRAGGEQRIPRPAAWRIEHMATWVERDVPTSDEIAAAVAEAALHQLPMTPTFPDARPSAVLVALVDGDNGAEVLLTKRSEMLRNHRGEISLPGGRLDPGESPVEAALREADEEVGLAPAAVRVHGQLSHLSTIVSRSYIVPVVGTIDERPQLTPHDREVARILWVPVAELISPTTFREEWWGTPPLDRRMIFFELDDETIWGATAAILYELLSIVYGPPNARTAP